MIPAVVMAQRNMAHMNNNLPAMSALQVEIVIVVFSILLLSYFLGENN